MLQAVDKKLGIELNVGIGQPGIDESKFNVIFEVNDKMTKTGTGA